VSPNTYEYKSHKKEESKTVKAKQKDLKEDIAKLKKQLQEQGARREQYAQLEQFNRDLKAKIKAKDLTIEQMQNETLTPNAQCSMNTMQDP